MNQGTGLTACSFYFKIKSLNYTIMITKEVKVQSVELTPEDATIVAEAFIKNTEPVNVDHVVTLVKDIFKYPGGEDDPISVIIKHLKTIQFRTKCKAYLDAQKEIK